MRWNTHLVFGLLFGILYLWFFGADNKYLFVGFVLFASLLPDLDHPESKIGRKVRPISWLIKNIFGHRGLFHSVWPALILYFVFVYVFGLRIVGLGLGVGFLSHLVSDALTKEGVNFGYPIAKAKVSGFVRTGGLTEWVFFAVVCVLCYLRIDVLL